jgi:hypothetical protein
VYDALVARAWLVMRGGIPPIEGIMPNILVGSAYRAGL